MTVYEFERLLLQKHPGDTYFDKEWLKFFGITKSRIKVLPHDAIVTDYLGTEHVCYVIYSYQRNAPEGINKRHFDYFDKQTLERVFKKED